MKELHYFVQTSFFELYEFELQRVELWWGNDEWVSLSSLSKKQQQIIWLQHKQILSFFYTRDNKKTCGAYSHCGPIRNIYGWVFFLMFIIVFVGSIQNSNYRKNNSDDNNNNNNTNNNTNYSSNSYNGNNSNTYRNNYDNSGDNTTQKWLYILLPLLLILAKKWFFTLCL